MLLDIVVINILKYINDEPICYTSETKYILVKMYILVKICKVYFSKNKKRNY